MIKEFKCKCCGKSLKMTDNSVFKIMTNFSDKEIIAETTKFANHNSDYDKQRLSILMRFKRKISEKQIELGYLRFINSERNFISK